MTDSNYAHISIVADRSGSMGLPADGKETKAVATTRGIHELVREQRKFPGKTTFSLTDFDTELTRVASFTDGSLLEGWACHPRGNTALLDAVGTLITETGEALEKMPEDQRPGRVYFVISTDGKENWSHEYELEQVRQMITRQQDAYGWEFIFIGVGPDSYGQAGGMGISSAATLDAATAAAGTTYLVTNTAVSRSRATGQSVRYSDEEREQTS